MSRPSKPFIDVHFGTVTQFFFRLVNIERPNLSITDSTRRGNIGGVLLHKRFGNCLSALAPRYDHIIIDSPPILAVTDAAIIGQIVGGTLMVLKAGEHPMREIEQAARRLQQANVNLRGILFNDIVASSQRYGAGKYHYHYSYKNG